MTKQFRRCGLRRILAGLVACTLLAAVFSLPGAAATYIFDPDDEPVYSPDIYSLSYTVQGDDMPCGAFSEATDVYVDADDRVYILDTGNNRVVMLDERCAYRGTLSVFRYQGQELTLSAPKGLFYHDGQGRLYISDTGHDRILVSDLEGNVERIIEKPETALIDASLSFQPTKLIVDNLGIVFAQSANVNTGLLIIFPDDSFGGFFGANTIETTADVLQEFVWRRIFSYSQYNASTSYQSTEYNNIYWSEKDRCIYAVTPSAGNASAEITKLNAVGDDLLSKTKFGEPDDTAKKEQNFIDITVDTNDLFMAVDRSSGRIYQYDQNCNLLGVFGGKGATEDTFKDPVALESNSRNELLVLDAGKNCLSVFTQTSYGQTLQQALALYRDGQYAECIDLWQDLLRKNANLFSAHIGMGKAYMQLGEYTTAMEYFKNAMDQDDYALAKAARQEQWLNRNFATVAIVVIAVFLLVYFYEPLARGVRYLWRRVHRKGGETE